MITFALQKKRLFYHGDSIIDSRPQRCGILFRLATLTLLLGCTAPTPHSTKAPAQQQQHAFYQNKPTDLFTGLSNYCVTPAQHLERLSPSHIRCHQFLDPETTADLILAYTGSPQDLPTLIGGISSVRGQFAGQSGFLVTFETYINVPQANGPPIRVFHRNPAIIRAYRTMLRVTGGTEVPQAL